MSEYRAPRTVLVTGGAGNLGAKVIEHLVSREPFARIVALDRPGGSEVTPHPKVEIVMSDLADAADRAWWDAMRGVDAVVHLATQDAQPNASWQDSAAGFAMTARLIHAAASQGVARFVFASSNHTMGGYKDPPLADTIAPGGLRTDLPPAPGTRYHDGKRLITENAYGAQKLLGEEALTARCNAPDCAMTGVSLRIGWCQPGENHPRTLNPSGVAAGAVAEGEGDPRDLAWFRNMWLSNRDFVHLVERALVADPAQWPARGIVVNGMSNNRGMAWDIETTRRLIGYAPQDDVWASLG